MLFHHNEETMRYSFCIAIFLPSSALAATLTVGTGGTYSTISDAVSAASDGDIIEVSAGTYTETIRIDTMKLEIKGVDGSGSTFVSASSTEPALSVIDSDMFSVGGFTLSSTDDRGFIIEESTGSLSDLVVEGHAVLGDGAGGFISDSEVDLSDSVFSGNNAGDYDGGNLYLWASTVDISDSSFISGYATFGGGVYAGNSSNLTISDSSFSDNNVDSNGSSYGGHGGGLRVSQSTATLTDCSFDEDYAGDSANGGAIAIRASSLTLEGVTISDTSAGRDGGAIYVDDSDLVASDLSVSGAYAGFKGGGLTAWNSDIEISASDFSSNYAEGSSSDGSNWTGSGGALFLSGSPTEISGSTFDSNSADNVAGGIFADEEISISDSWFSSNASGYGGAVYVTAASASIAGSTFSENSATSTGGALRWRDETHNETFTISTTSFAENSAGNYGGAIAIYDGDTLSITSTSFTDNSSTSGGALYMNTVTASLDTTTFSGNTATGSGGGIRWEDDVTPQNETLSITNSVFEGNIADGYGGAFAIRDGESTLLTDNTFFYNIGDMGGAISIYDIEAVQSLRNDFCGNVASDHAGAVRLNAAGATQNTWKNNVYVENYAATDGGAFYILDSGAVDIVNNTLLGNDAANGGGLWLSNSEVNFINNIVAWTTSGYAIEADSASSGKVEYFDFYSNSPGALNGSSISMGTTGITSPPMLSELSLDGVCGNDQLWPQAGSPLIDAGDPSISDNDGTTSDIGAFGGPDAPSDPATTDADADGYTADVDCDDNDDTVHPGASDTCDDGVDQDCDGVDLACIGTDVDGDGYCAAAACSDGSTPGDCNDSDVAVYPGASEVCNGIDDDCNGIVDGSSATGQSTFYFDLDGDGFGNTAIDSEACDAPNGYVADNTDCNDNNPTVYPSAEELCDSLDNDCNGAIDDNVPNPPTWYQDLDGDGFGDPNTAVSDCDEPTGYVNIAEDCDDNNPSVSPAESEVCNGVDDDCDGSIDEDATDGDPWFEDQDDDGYGNPTASIRACSKPDGYSDNNTDCNDGDGDTYPGAPEECVATVDYNCDGQAGDPDMDGDGFVECLDCNDTDPGTNPEASEIWYDGIDQNCDELSDFDQDGDGYDFEDFGGTDCDDMDATIYPGAEDPKGDEIDSNCDGKDGINPKANDPAPTEELKAVAECGCAVSNPGSSALFTALLPLLALMRRRERALP
jgi:predicted outer membrane repeat protein